jgi:hypothetical protein
MKPPNEKGALLHAPISKLPTGEYHRFDAAQAVWLHWQRQAATFVAEFWDSGDERHLHAFIRHVSAMRAHAERGEQ